MFFVGILQTKLIRKYFPVLIGSGIEYCLYKIYNFVLTSFHFPFHVYPIVIIQSDWTRKNISDMVDIAEMVDENQKRIRK